MKTRSVFRSDGTEVTDLYYQMCRDADIKNDFKTPPKRRALSESRFPG